MKEYLFFQNKKKDLRPIENNSSCLVLPTLERKTLNSNNTSPLSMNKDYSSFMTDYTIPDI